MPRPRKGNAYQRVMPKRNGKAPTLRELGRRWTSGELALEHPDHVKDKRSADNDVSRLERYVYPVAGDVPIDRFTLDHAELVMRGIPPERASATRRHVAQLLHRLCAMAVFRLRLIAASPLRGRQGEGWDIPGRGCAAARVGQGAARVARLLWVPLSRVAAPECEFCGIVTTCFAAS